MGLSLSSDRREEETPATVATVALRPSHQPNWNQIFDFGFAFGLIFLALQYLPLWWQSPITNSCTICQEEFAPGEKVCVLPRCKHMFHDHCLCDWIMSNGTCPLCRDRVIDPRVVGWRGGLLGRF